MLGRVTNEQFRMLSADYDDEQKALREAIPVKEARLQKLMDSASNVDAFIQRAKQYTEIRELTPEIVGIMDSVEQVAAEDAENTEQENSA